MAVSSLCEAPRKRGRGRPRITARAAALREMLSVSETAPEVEDVPFGDIALGDVPLVDIRNTVELPASAVACAVMAHLNGFWQDVFLNTAERESDGTVRITTYPYKQYRVRIPDTFVLERARFVEEN